MRILFLLTGLLLSVGSVTAENRVEAGLFSKQDISGWKQKKFVGETDYRLVKLDQVSVLQASSKQSASAFYLKLKVDLTKTPNLHWSWRKQQQINPGNESDKTGDDFVARVYVIKKGGLLFWNTRAINYVWSYQHKKNEDWDSPFAGSRSKMFSQRDDSDPEQVWFNEHTNVVEDFKRLHDQDIRTIDGIAIMTDSDNSGLSAKALYGDIYFSEK